MWISSKCVYIYLFSLLGLPPNPLSHHRASSWALCAIQQLPTSYLFYTWQCIYVNATLAIHPTLHFPTESTSPFSTSVSLLLLSCSVVFDSFVTPWTAAPQASLSFTISQRLLKLMFIELVVPYNNLTPCHHLVFLPSMFLSIRVFSNESALHIRWPKSLLLSCNMSF